MIFYPGAVIGFIGGGQLAKMLCIAAANLDYKTVILDPDPDCPAASVASRVLVAPHDNLSALDELARISSLVTYESENTPSDSMDFLAQRICVYPPVQALRITQDRLLEKNFLREIGLDTASFFTIDSEDQLVESLALLGGSGILKTRCNGYDGRGQVWINDSSCVHEVYSSFNSVPLILESIISFEKEISIIAARDVNGHFVSYDPSENVHRGGILYSSSVPAKIPSFVADSAREAAFLLLERLGYVGVAGVEFFLLSGDRLLVNELAPRVHNSGHWTEAACLISQFEQHIRAICGLPLGGCILHSACIMENLIGSDVERYESFLSEPNLLLRLYGKKEIRSGRKMGHFTRLFRFS